jgi:hypothetical protein
MVTKKKAVGKTVSSVKKTEKKGGVTGIRNAEDAQRVLRHVPDEKRFYCHDGKILNNIYELKSALENMDENTYKHHVTGEKNDFARWVREVLLDDKLANDLGKCASSSDAMQVVAERIIWLQART